MRDTHARRVVVISQLPPPVHGSTIMTRHFLDAMRAIGTSARLVDRRFSRSADEVGRASGGKALAVPSLVSRLLAATRRRPAAAILFITNRPGSFLVDSLLVRLLKGRGVPLVLYVHTVGFAGLAARGGAWKRLVRSTLDAGDRVVVLGDRLVHDVAAFVPPARIRVVPNTAGQVPAAQATTLAQGGSSACVLFLSNLLPEKGVDDFIGVAASLVERAPSVDWRFRIAGAGSPERIGEISRHLDRAGIADRTELLGAVDVDDKWRVLREASVLVFPSRYPYEAQPLTIVESLSVGTPVVAYDIGGIGDLVGEHVGALVPAGDRPAMVDALLALEQDGTLGGRRRESVLEHAARSHSAAAYAGAWRGVLDEVSAPIASQSESVDDGFAGDFASFVRLVREDWRANPRDFKPRTVLLGFRFAQLAMGSRDRLRLRAVLPVALYRAWTEWGYGLELRPKTRIGGGLTIYHGFALVVNDHTVIGRGVVLRNGVTIGNRESDGGSPRIGNDVQIGAGAILLGPITIGDGARVGAGAVVLHDVPAGAAVVGNPARIVSEAPVPDGTGR
ncbi:glycosyltransferase [uncultured Amnibacterium sp.]|uniref:glycosyltransferase n=1 Tax=uncultured Amnibacterium sp. TaxID=1631851 RepID=UPI0035CC4C48